MKIYFEVRPKFKGSSSGSVIENPPEAQHSSDTQLAVPSNFANEREKNVELETLIADPGRRKLISEYHPDIQNEEKQKVHYANLIEEGSIVTGSGLNQESSIVRAGDTRWGSHFRTLTSLMTLYTPVLGVLEEVGDDSSFDRHGEAVYLLDLLQSFDFIFLLYLMVEVLGISHDLNVALQRCDQDLLNALKLVNIAKQRLQEMRDDGWKKLLSKVVAICNKHEFDVPDMDALYIQGKKSRRRTSSISNMHHYKNDCLFSVLDLQLQELNARFDVENTELLYCVACLSPSSSFAAFDEDKLLRMVELYPNDFVEFFEVIVRNQLQNYIKDVRYDPDF